MSYNFSVLNDKEFERLSRDILNISLSLNLQDFKPGKDQGRDLRYSSPKNANSIVVQAKHYYKSGYKAFIKELKKELPKIQLLKPDRYIVTTSVELNARNKDEICNFFKPYIKTANDIFGNEDLNKILETFPDIETKWHKLWLSSVNILNNILHNSISGRSAFVESKIRKTIQLYVPSESYNDALDILVKHKYILITGQPGVGKTTLAHLLSYRLLSDEYQLIYIDSDVEDAERLFSSSPTVKQLFFFDDFLGSNILEIYQPKTSESAFVTFLQRIQDSKEKYLILTTRTTIYKNAIDRYEKMRRMKVDIARKEIELGQYTLLDKAKILYNHLYHSDIAKSCLQQIFANKNYWKIIRHRNYNPRIIEFVTDTRNLISLAKNGYMNFILKTLENPEEVWKHAYEQQFTGEETLLLHSIYSQKETTSIEDTKAIFSYMLEYEVRCNNHKPAKNPFNNACKNLLDGILKKEVNLYKKQETISFLNPSPRDFLNNYFKTNVEEKWNLFKRSIFIEQFEQYAQNFYTHFEKTEKSSTDVSSFANHILDRRSELKTYAELKQENERTAYLNLRIGALLKSFLDVDETTSDRIEEFCFDIISSYPLLDINDETFDYYVTILKYSWYDSKLYNYVVENWSPIMRSLYENSSSSSQFEEIDSLFSEFSRQHSDFFKEKPNYTSAYDSVAQYIDEATAQWVADEEDEIYSTEDWDALKERIKQKRDEYFAEYHLSDTHYSEKEFFNDAGLERLISTNLFYRRNNKDLSTKIQKLETPDASTNLKEEREINALFS